MEERQQKERRKKRTSKMVQWIKLPAAKPGDLGSMPRTHRIEGESLLPQANPPAFTCAVCPSPSFNLWHTE